MEQIKQFSAEWSNDCQGKKDYDGEILRISTRYWPSNRQSNGKSSAQSTVMLMHKRDTEVSPLDWGYTELKEQEFEGEDEQDVKNQVEVWCQAEYEKIVRAIKSLYI